MDTQCQWTMEVAHGCREITIQIYLPRRSFSFPYRKGLICTQIVLTLLSQSDTWKSIPPRQELVHMHCPSDQKCAFETNPPAAFITRLLTCIAKEYTNWILIFFFFYINLNWKRSSKNAPMVCQSLMGICYKGPDLS